MKSAAGLGGAQRQPDRERRDEACDAAAGGPDHGEIPRHRDEPDRCAQVIIGRL